MLIGQMVTGCFKCYIGVSRASVQQGWVSSEQIRGCGFSWARDERLHRARKSEYENTLKK